MKEKQIEEYLRRKVRDELGGIAYKFTSPGRRSVPDRICVIPDNIFFVECKAPGKHATTLQLREHAKLEALGHWVYVVSSKYTINKIIEFWKRRIEDAK